MGRGGREGWGGVGRGGLEGEVVIVEDTILNISGCLNIFLQLSEYPPPADWAHKAQIQGVPHKETIFYLMQT